MPSVVLRVGLFASVAGAVAALDEFSGCSGASVASPRTFGGEHLTWLFGKPRRSCSKTCGDFPCIEKELDEIRSPRAFKKMLKLVGGGPGGNPPVCTEFSGAQFPGTTDRNLFAPYFYEISDECFYVSGKGKGRATPTCDARAEAEGSEGKGKGKGAYNRFCPCEVPCQKPCQYCQALCGSKGFNLTLGGGYLQCKQRCLQSFGELQLGFLDDYCERGRCRTDSEEEQKEVAGQPDDLNEEEEEEETHLLQYQRSIERDEPGGKDLSVESDLEHEIAGRDPCRTRRQYCERLCRFELTDDPAQDCERACRRNFKGFKTVFKSYCTLGACGGKKCRKETHEEDEGEDTPLLQSADDEDNDGGEDEVEVGGEVTSLLQHAVRTSSPGGLEL